MTDERKVFVIKDSSDGSVRVADDVISSIAALAAAEVEGVTALSNSSRADDLIGRLSGKAFRGVNVSVKDDKVKLELNLSISYGYEIPTVCQKVQEKVKYAIENMTGLEVVEINIHISAMENEKKEA